MTNFLLFGKISDKRKGYFSLSLSIAFAFSLNFSSTSLITHPPDGVGQ